jgi:hypothetical protein
MVCGLWIAWYRECQLESTGLLIQNFGIDYEQIRQLLNLVWIGQDGFQVRTVQENQDLVVYLSYLSILKRR